MVSVASRHFMVTELTDITALVYRWCPPVVNEVLFGVRYSRCRLPHKKKTTPPCREMARGLVERVIHHPVGIGDIREADVPIGHNTIDKKGQ